MSIQQSTNSPQKKITVTIPQELLLRLDKFVPQRQRSQFIALAIQTQLAIAEQANAIEESAGIWRDEDYPEMKTDEDIDAWLKELRQGWSTTMG